jgi:hypothetical protein
MPQLAAVVVRCLQPDPEARYADMRALINGLDHPETIDISILDQDTGAESSVPFWQSPFGAVIRGFLILFVITMLALLAQAIRSTLP